MPDQCFFVTPYRMNCIPYQKKFHDNAFELLSTERFLEVVIHDDYPKGAVIVSWHQAPFAWASKKYLTPVFLAWDRSIKGIFASDLQVVPIPMTWQHCDGAGKFPAPISCNIIGECKLAVFFNAHASKDQRPKEGNCWLYAPRQWATSSYSRMIQSWETPFWAARSVEMESCSSLKGTLARCKGLMTQTIVPCLVTTTTPSSWSKRTTLSRAMAHVSGGVFHQSSGLDFEVSSYGLWVHLPVLLAWGQGWYPWCTPYCPGL